MIEDYFPEYGWIPHPVEVENWTGYDSYRLKVLVAQFTECKKLSVYNNTVINSGLSFTGTRMSLFLPKPPPLIRTYDVIKAIQCCFMRLHEIPPESVHTRLLEYVGYNLINYRPSIP